MILTLLSLLVFASYIGVMIYKTKDIHTAQMKEMLYVFFYVWYVVEWLVRLFMKGNAYRNISFEREAYGNERYIAYIGERKRYAWVGYLKKA